MKLKTVTITDFKGVNKNAVEGVTQTQPTILEGFDFDRAGGYRAALGQEALTVSGTLAGTIVGSDDTGFISFRVYDSSTSFPRGRVTMRVYDGSSTVTEVVDGFNGTSASVTISTSSAGLQPIHLPQTGVYVYPGDSRYGGVDDTTDDGPIYLVRDTNGTWRDSVTTETMSESTSSSITTSGSTFNANIEFWGGFSTQTGTFMWPAAEETVSGDFNEAAATLTYSSAPGKWVAYAFSRQGSSTTVAYDLAPADSSGSFAATISSASAVFTDGVNIGVMTPPIVSHRQRVWGLFDRDLGAALGNVYFKEIAGATFFNLVKRLPRKRTLWYTEIGYANLWGNTNYVVVDLYASDTITALASSPAGLLIFGENESHLMRGDPATPASFSVQLASGVIGCDDGVTPVRLGGTVFVIYKGEIYAFALGMGDVDFGQGIHKISDPVYDPSFTFTELASEPTSRHLVAKTVLTTQEKFYRFDVEKQEWVTDVYETTDNVSNVFSNPDDDGARYYTTSNSGLNGAHGTVSNPRVRWENVDLGDKLTKKLWRRIRISTNDTYSGTPTLEYSIAGQSATISGSNVSGDKEFVFTLPSGLVATTANYLEVTFVGATKNSTLEPPLVVEYVERYKPHS